MNTQDKFSGALLGLAIGDALGAPTEFLSADQIRNQYGDAGISGFDSVRGLPPGAYTDDTQMTIAVAEALLEAGNEELDMVMAAMSRRFVEWMESPECNRSPSSTCLQGCRNLGRGVSWHQAGVADSKGCGSAMRVAPIGLYYANDEERLIEIATSSAVLTHGHKTARAAAAAAALLVAWAVRGEDPADYSERLVSRLDTLDGAEEVAAMVAHVPGLLAQDPADVLRTGELGEAWVADEAVASALYCFARTPDDYRQTVLTAANATGDSDSIACIAGGISGAYNGTAGLPQDWCTQVENREYLEQLGQRLHQAVGK